MINIFPITTEKALAQSQKRVYMFNVPMKSSKQLIAENVEKQFGVTVLSVTTLVRDGKKVRFNRGKRRMPGATFRQDSKIAYVLLKEGDKIKVFDEEPTAEEKKAGSKENVKVAQDDTAVKAETKKAGLFTKRRTGNRGDK